MYTISGKKMSANFYFAYGVKKKWPKLESVWPTSLTYDDVLIIPNPATDIKSRQETDISVKFGPYKLRIPLVSAPMDTIVGETMVRKLAALGAISTYPRANGRLKENLKLCKQFNSEGIPCIYAVSLKNYFDEAKAYFQNGAKVILIDVAHGGMKSIEKAVDHIKTKFKMTVIAGNIVTYEQALRYKNCGVDIVRVGVGPGGLCKTRLVAGVGFPQLSAILEIKKSGLPIIADGGIRFPADLAKAIAAGASVGMIGSLFAGCEETPGEIIGGTKLARGQASESYMKDNGVEVGEFRAAEGIEVSVPFKGSVARIVGELTGGLRSAFSYVGAKNIADFQRKAQFVLVTHSVQAENKPHIRY